MRIILVYIFLIILSAEFVSAESIYPFKINNFSDITGGEAVPAYELSSNIRYFYMLTYDFTKGSEKISIINTDNPKDNKGIIISNSKVVAHTLHNNNLLIISQESGGIYISFVNPYGTRFGKQIIAELNIPEDMENCQIIELISGSQYLLNLNSKLYKIEINNQQTEIDFIVDVTGKLLKLDNSSGFNNVEFAIVESINGGQIISFFDINLQFQFMTKLVSYQKGIWKDLGTMLAYYTVASDNQTFIQLIDKQNGLIISGFWINAQQDKIILKLTDNNLKAFYIETSLDGYSICRADIDINNPKVVPVSMNLSGNMINPLKIDRLNDNLVVLFANTIILLDTDLNILAKQFYPVDNKLNNIDNILSDQNRVYLLSSPSSIQFDLIDNKYWHLKKVYSDIRYYLFPIFLGILLIIFIQLYRHQRRLVSELLDLSNIGLLFVVDSSGRLININNVAKDFLEMRNIPLRKFFSYYVKNSKAEPFARLINKTLETKDSLKQKITIKINNSETEWICKTIPLRNITGMFRGVVLSAVDITEQLERKRLSNWAQLAHDMQTNLSTIKLNAEHLDIELSENNKQRQRRIIFQVNLLMQRVRDIITVGRSDSLNLEQHNICEVCNDVRNEFDELMFPNVKFEMDCKHFLVNCDRPKLIRAVRNAAENGIKSMKGNPGTITISAYHDKNFAVIKVVDTGSGMDEETKRKMLTPYFTTAGNSGGSGIGTMIMQHVTEQHGGFLTVNSEKGVGTEVIFNIPNTLSHRKEKSIIDND
ncbi:MAG: PAS domain-containing protein [Candidatus Kapabacteria bacterium]|nr:PAS domain-containing protein [Ignavibacteriota bacterium]MCW5884198.1 PAS domain-containing protein [Candidatus Kapabacteria bacterium]